MEPASRSTYDAVPYPSSAHAQTHPDQLAIKAMLLGLNPPAVESCRVLELGCGDGTNLVSIALSLPKAAFLGIDLATESIGRGRELIQGVGLGNVTLRAGSVLDIGPEFGQFDYIIAHGLYSWVPDSVRDKVMSICKANLAPQGVAHISYNVHPGGHLRQMLRGMMLYHTRAFATPPERVNQGLALVKFLADSKSEPNRDPYRHLLQEQFDYLSHRDPSILFHDDFSPEFHPVWFHEFCDHARRHGLQFLAEADYLDPDDGGYTPATTQVLRQLSSNRLAREQYSDFLSFRRFRQSLICHAETRLRFGVPDELLRVVHVSCPARPVAGNFEAQSNRLERFAGEGGAGFALDHPFLKTAVAILGGHWPRSMPFTELVERTGAQRGTGSGGARENEARRLFDLLLGIYVPGLARLHLVPPRFASEPGTRPMASPLARCQARGTREVTNLRHFNVVLENDAERNLLQNLDGTHDWAELQGITSLPEAAVNEMLGRFAMMALFVEQSRE